MFLFLVSGIIHADEICIFFLGNTHFGDNYQLNPKYNRSINVIKKNGYDYFFENVKDILLHSDFTFANLETPLIFNPQISVEKSDDYLHWSDSDSTVFYLNKYHIMAVSLANNHVFDSGTEEY